jgi:penicillin G amidase
MACSNYERGGIMGRKTRIACSILIVCGVFTALPVLSYWQWIWADLLNVNSPKILQTLDYHPVEIMISFKDGAIANTFKASLNGHDITHDFKPVAGGVHAYVTPDEGLNCHIIGKNPAWSKINFLVTNVQGNGYKKDLKLTEFNVEYYPVKTVRDNKGVWFITGGSLADVMESMGYAVATDRLWQMETYRRSARGRLAEIFGSSQLQTDIFTRTIGYTDQELSDGFNDLDRDEQIIIESYVEGINKRIDDIKLNPTLTPFEFLATGCPLNYWSEADVLAWMALLLREFDCEALELGQIENAALFQQLTGQYGPTVGYGMFNDLRWVNDPNALTYIPPVVKKAMAMTATAPAGAAAQTSSLQGTPAVSDDFQSVYEDLAARKNTVTENLKQINAFVKMGSYAWSVSGKKTADGKPIIYSGPQMGFSVPSIVIEGSIRGGGITASGMSVPGIPGIIIGRTPHHAWSMQVGHAHTVDYYVESSSGVSLNRVETIHIIGQSDYTLSVFRSKHGPIINQNPLIAWKYSHWGYEFKTVKAFLNLARAQSMDDFGKAIEDVAVSQHFCYADKYGNIAYWMSGRDPVRPAGEWRLPQGILPAVFGPSLEWNASVLIPKSTDRNNAKGYYCGWNNKSNPSYNDSVNSPGYFFGPFHRAHVIDDYLSANNNLTYEEVRDLALYIATTDSFGSGGIPWDFVEKDFTLAVNNIGLNPVRQAALDLLKTWDGHFVDGGPSEWRQGVNRADAWILQDAWIREVVRLTFADKLKYYYNPNDSAVIDRLFNVLLHGLADNFNTFEWLPAQTRDGVIVQALDNVLAALDLNNRPWGTGKRGVITYTHNLLGVVHAMPFSSRSTYAHCVEFGPGGPIRVESMFPLGESGNIPANFNGTNFDPNFFSMTPIFDPFEPRPFPLFN